MKKRLFFIFLLILYLLGLYIFYIRYVPLVENYQIAIVPILFLVFILCAIKLKLGLLFFIFSFPLINNLPYFFGIHEPLPHAPSALVLFLFFFLGWLVHQIFYGPEVKVNAKIFFPATLFCIITVISALITFWRYTNFVPVISDEIYELVVNVLGGTAGGALMSVVFFSLNYLTEIAFFMIIFNEINSIKYIEKIILIISISTILSFNFGLYQKAGHLDLGNNPISIRQGLINGTFKDALSFGSYIAIITPVLLAGAFYFHKAWRYLFIIVSSIGLYLLLFTGSRSGLLSAVLAISIFLVLQIKYALKKIRISKVVKKEIGLLIMVVFLFLLLFILAYIGAKKQIFSDVVTVRRLFVVLKTGKIDVILSDRIKGIWQLAALMLKDYPFTGLGIGSYIIESANYAQAHNIHYGVPESAENYFLQIGSELGLIGIFIVLGVWWQILKKLGQNHKRISFDRKTKFLLIGVGAGVIAFLIIVQVHTYIGSYEIKYTFWLLVGLIYAIGKIEGINEEFKLNKRMKLFGLIVVILFFSINLWNSTHSLSLRATTKKYNLYQVFGFFPTEKTIEGREFRWTGKYAGMSVKIEKPIIAIPILASHPDIYLNPIRVKIYIIEEFFKKKTLLKEITLTRNIWEIYKFYLPDKVGQEVIILFKINRTWTPLKSKRVPDPRNLGIAIGKLEFFEKVE